MELMNGINQMMEFTDGINQMMELADGVNQVMELTDGINQMDLTDIFTQALTKNTFFSEAHGTFSKTDHISGHKASLNRQQKVKITPAFYLMTMDYTWISITES